MTENNVTPLYGRDDIYNEYERTLNELAQAYLAMIRGAVSSDRDEYEVRAELFDDCDRAAEKFVEVRKKFLLWLEYHRQQQEGEAG
jgi:hypothetical protein